MAYRLLAHHEKVLVSKGQVLNGKCKTGIIGTSGKSTGKHLHVQDVVKLTHSKIIDNFDGYCSPYNYPQDPKIFNDKYGKSSVNDVTCSFGYSGQPYSASWTHQGIDYSGVIDKDYETQYSYSPSKAKCKVIDTGYHVEFGNYVVLEILGYKENGDDTMHLKWNKVERIEIIKSGRYLANVELKNGLVTNNFTTIGEAQTHVGDRFDTIMVTTKEGAENGKYRARMIVSGGHAGTLIYSRWDGTNKCKVVG